MADKIAHFTEGGELRPYICGGFIYNSGSSDSCYQYDVTLDEWTLSGTMPEERVYSGYDHSEMLGLIMAGGYNGNYLSSVTTTESGEVFGSLPDLPNENRLSCVVIIDEDRIFTCGGSLTPSDTLIFSNSTGTWSR